MFLSVESYDFFLVNYLIPVYFVINEPKTAFTCSMIWFRWLYAYIGYILQWVINLSILFKINRLGSFYIYNWFKTRNVWLETPSTTSTTSSAESVSLRAAETSQ